MSGGANYAIPIAVPPGINGVVPQISLVYNSQGSGGGLARYGWNISGVSSITRIASTKFHDGIIDPVDFDNLDRFAFDGQRLIVKSGTSGVYGANGTKYETESFSNIKITSYGVHSSGANYGPAYFIVEYPDGSKAYYGNSSNSRSITDWAIAYWENPQRVRISYSYNLANNSLCISSIKYGSISTNMPINQIEFEYKNRQRPEQLYVGGQTILSANLLSKINVIGNGQGFRSYTLGHDQTSLSYERLTAVTETSGDGSKSYNPTVFSYETTNNTDLFKIQPTTTIGLKDVDNQNTGNISGDFDGDGKTDIILYPIRGTDSKKKYWFFRDIAGGSFNPGYEHAVGAFDEIFPVSFLSSDSKMMPYQGWVVAKEVDSKYIFTIWATGSTSSISSQYEKIVNFPLDVVSEFCKPNCDILSRSEEIFPKRILSGDFNGDGLTDVLAIDQGTATSSYCGDDGRNRCLTQSQNLSSRKVYFVDLKRDNTTEFIYSGNLQTALSVTTNVQVIDFNGDGKSDFVVFEPGFLKVYTLDAANELVLLYENTTTDASIVLDKPILMGDYNGDGKTDFVIPQTENQDNWNFYFSTGTTLNKVNTAIGLAYYTSKLGYYGVIGFPATTYSLNEGSFIANDYNGDGKTDILYQQNLTVEYIMASSGDIYARKGETQITKLVLLENKSCTGTAVSFTLVNKQSQFAGVKRYPIPIFTNHNRINLNLEYSLISGSTIQSFKSPIDNRIDVLLKKITTGNGVKEIISYSPLQQDQYEPFYTPNLYIENYPNVDINVASGFKIVTKLEKESATVYKKQLFSYAGAVSNLEGIGFLGFRATARTNWHDDDGDMVSSIAKNDISLRGANIENYSVAGYASSNAVPATFITKSITDYNTAYDALQDNKVFKLKILASKEINTLDNTSSETTNEYDVYNNPTKSTTLLKQGESTLQSMTTTVSYLDPTIALYSVGIPSGKNQSVTVEGDVISTQEDYQYSNSLLSQIRKKGTNTDFITEENYHDSFGNIVTKIITVKGLIPRMTRYEYDPSGRFLIKSTDIEKLSTNFTYNSNNGLLDSQTNPNGLTTSYAYDSWFKKIKTTDYLGKSNTCVYTRNGNNSVITTTGDDGSQSEETFDDLGRKIKAGSKNIMGTFSYVDYVYDIYDRNYKVSEPYIGTGATQWNETKYDQYGRVIQSIAFTGKITDISYSGLSTTVNDGTKSKTSVKNVMGNVVSMTDTPGGTIKYTYFANGNLKESDYAGVKTTISQDGWGRKTQLVDTSAGTYTYEYNGFGETTKETTPNGTTTYILDEVGKVAQKTISGINTNSKTTYTYDSASKLLTNSKFEDFNNGTNTITNTYSYDTYRRIINTLETAQFASFAKALSYDTFGRVISETSTGTAGGKTSVKTIKNTYKNGAHWQILDNATSSILWQTDGVNARGQLTSAQNGPTTITNSYDIYGFALQLKYNKTSDLSNILTLNTVFDAKKGNLISRNNSLFNKTESFVYDLQDRLTEFTNAKGEQEKQLYDDQGRITENNLGTYTYSNDKPYQNTSIALTAEALNSYSDRGNNVNQNPEVLNDGMENQTGWGTEKYPSNFIYGYSIGGAHGGRVSLKLDNKTSSKSYVYSDKWININNAADTQYTVSAWVYTYYGQGEIGLFAKSECGTDDNILLGNIVAESQLKWTKITKNILVPAYIKKLNIRLDSNYSTVWFDDVQINKAQIPVVFEETAEVFNDGIETQTGWGTVKYPNTNFNNYAIGGAHGGKVSLGLDNKTNTKYYVHSDKWININNKVDTQYTISAWIYTYYGQGELVLFMKKECETGYYTQTDNIVAESHYKWTKITKTILVPASIKKLNIRLDSNYGSVWFDDIQISRTDPPEPIEPTENVQNISYNVFKSPVEIEETGIDKIAFNYNDNNSRSAMFYGGLQTDKLQRPLRKYYSADGTMEIKQNIVTGIFEFVTYIGGDGYDAPIVLKSDGTSQNYLYLQRDYQGSIVAITDQTGAVLEKRLFDAWGGIVKVQDGAGNVLNGLTILDRGYTGHEHLQSVGLINMNGRIYDPKLHRFLQPDNFVEDPFNTQNYNRYGYVLNNPLKYTDVSGEIFGWDDLAVAFIGGVINWGTHGFQFNGAGAAYFGTGMAAGIATYYGGPYAGAAVLGVGNSITDQVSTTGKINLGQVAGDTAMSLGTAYLGGQITQGLSPYLDKTVGQVVKSSILKESLTQGLTNATGGFIIGAGMAKANGASFNEAVSSGWSGAKSGFAMGVANGLVVGYINVKASKVSNADVALKTQAEPTTLENTAGSATLTKIGDGSYKIEGIEFATSSTSTAPSRNYTIYEADGTLYKFGVSDANFIRMNQSLKEAGLGATAKFSDIVPKFQAHMNETYMRSLHYNSTGNWKINGMTYPYPRNFDTGIRINKP